MTKFDVLVIGGGPGGLSAAESAARSGCSVLVIEQGREIGAPTRTTGGSFVHDMREMGIPEHLYHPVRRCRFISPSNEVEFDYDSPVTCVMDVRGVFQFLAERAIDAGAIVRVGMTALEPILENGNVKGVYAKNLAGVEFTFHSKVLIDATGYRATMLKKSGTHPGYRRFGVGSEYDLYAPHCDQDEAILIVGSQIAPAGYAWVFPWGKGRVRVGVGIIHTDSDEHPDKYVDALISNAAQFRVDLRGAQPIEYHFGLIPSEGLASPFVGDGIMAVGDSAGQASALVGEGIRWAIKAGQMAGATAADAVKVGDSSRDFLARYQDKWRSAFGSSLRIAYEVNRRMSQYDDQEWDRKTELLKLLTPHQFGQVLQSNFTGGLALQLFRSNPSLLKEGFKELGQKLGFRLRP